MSVTETAATILHHTTVFLSDVVSQRELRRHLITTLQTTTIIPISEQQTTVKLAGDTLEAAISFSTSPSARSSSLSLAEKLLLPLLPQHPLSSFLLSLIRTLRNHHVDAAIPLLRIFHSVPSLSRYEIAPIIFDRLFSPHLVPVFRRFRERRARILSSDSSDCEMISLTRMNEDQASNLRELEREYEEILDANCGVFAAYFEEVLMSEDGDTSITPPLLIMRSFGNGEEAEEMEEIKKPVLKKERYNVREQE